MIRQGKPILSESFEKIKGLEKIFKSHEEVVLAYLFGSASTGKKTTLSDIDIAILLSEMNTYDELHFEMKLREDISKVLETEDFDLALLNRAPLVLRYQVLKTGKLLYSKDEVSRISFEETTRDMYFDFAPLRKEYYRIFFKNIEKGRMLGDRQE